MEFLEFKAEIDKLKPVFNNYRRLIESYSHYFIFPFTLQGCVNMTETGIKPEAIDISDYTYFSKVIAGNHPVVAT